MIDIEPKDEKSFMKMVQHSIASTMIEYMRDTESYDDDTVKTFLCTIVNEEFEIDFLKAIGLIHFKNDKTAMRVVNDFCGVLSDLMHEGKHEMKI